MKLIVNASAVREAEMASQYAVQARLRYLFMIFTLLSITFFSLELGSEVHSQVMGMTLHKCLWWVLILVFGSFLRARSSRHHEIELPPIRDNGTHTLLYNSDAYDISRAGLLDYVHEPYEKRILLAIGDEAEQSGVHLEQDSIHCMARDISWVPVQSFAYLSDTDLSCADGAKAFVEDRLGESWNWWPLAPRIHRLRSGYCRIQWKSVCISPPNLFSEA
jgi:hypothetical protein